MKTAVFSTKPYDAKFLAAANVNASHQFDFFEEKLNNHTAKLAEGNTAVCAFVNDALVEVIVAIHGGNPSFPEG